MKSEFLADERSLPNGTLYDSQLKACFPNVTNIDSKSPNVYVCGAVRKPQMIKLDGQMAVGEAISRCGGFEKAFGISIFRRRGETFSVITIRLLAESYKPSGYERIPLRKDDLIVVSEEGY